MKILGNVLFILGILIAASTSFGQTQLTKEQKIQQLALAAVFLSIGAWRALGKKKPNNTDKQ